MTRSIVCDNFRPVPGPLAWEIFLGWYAMQYRLPAEALRMLMAANPWGLP